MHGILDYWVIICSNVEVNLTESELLSGFSLLNSHTIQGCIFQGHIFHPRSWSSIWVTPQLYHYFKLCLGMFIHAQHSECSSAWSLRITTALVCLCVYILSPQPFGVSLLSKGGIIMVSPSENINLHNWQSHYPLILLPPIHYVTPAHQGVLGFIRTTRPIFAWTLS